MKSGFLPRVARLVFVFCCVTMCVGETTVFAAPRAPVELTQELEDGLEITVRESEPNDVATVMGVHLWKFAVRAPKPGISVRYWCELRQNGEAVKTLYTSAVGPLEAVDENPDRYFRNVPALVGLYKDTEKWNAYVRFGDSGSSSAVSALDVWQTRSFGHMAQFQKDGTFSLAEFGKTNNAPPEERLVFSMRFAIENDD